MLDSSGEVQYAASASHNRAPSQWKATPRRRQCANNVKTTKHLYIDINDANTSHCARYHAIDITQNMQL